VVMIEKDNAQLYTVEGIAAGILMLLVVIFIVKGAPLSSNTSSSSNKDVEGQLEILGQDLLTILDYSPEGSMSLLKKSLVLWDGQMDQGQNDNTNQALQEALWNESIVYNLEVSFKNSGGIENRRVFWNGEPSDNAITVSKKIVLHDDDAQTLGLGIAPGLDWPDYRPSYPIHNLDGNKTNFYNTVTVRLTLWRI
jgi:hypothetical protein